MHIGLFGGAFNPPHLGHLLIATQILESGVVDEVWFLPTYGQHHLRPDVVSPNHRLAMLRFLELPKTRISTLEIDHKLDGKTIHLLPYLPKGHDYMFIIGSDWLPSFHKWDQWEELLEHMPFLVVPRDGFPNEPLHKNMTVFNPSGFMSNNISATNVRRRIKEGLPIDLFVPQYVAEYIKEHKLYS